MINVKNNLSPIEEQQFIQEEQLTLQEILNQFRQPIPSGFIELGQPRKYWGSTEGWKEPVCERYSFRRNDKLITLDIEQKLSNKLKLTFEDNFYVSPEILTLEDDNKEEIIITINKEEEIFLDRPLTINDLPNFLQRWKDEIKTLKEQIQTLEREKTDNHQHITDLTNEREQSGDLQTTRDQLVATSILITNLRTLLRTNDLNNLPQIPEGETLASLLARPTPTDLQAERNKVNDLEKDKERLTREKNNIQTQRDNRPNITLAQWNNDYSQRPTQQQLNNLQIQLNSTRTELNNTKNERDDYQRRWSNHTCPSTYCSRRHYDSSCEEFYHNESTKYKNWLGRVDKD